MNGVVVRARSAIDATAQSTTIVSEVVVTGVVPNEFDSTIWIDHVPRNYFVMLLKLIF